MKQTKNPIPTDDYDIDTNKVIKKYDISKCNYYCNIWPCCIKIAIICIIFAVILTIYLLSSSIFYALKGDNTEHNNHIYHYNYIYRHKVKYVKEYLLRSDTYSYRRHHRKKCSDYKYGCCMIYDINRQYSLDLHHIIPSDAEHSNCPTYKDLINNYNIWRENYYYEHNNTNCEINNCCKLNYYEDELKNHRNPKFNKDHYDIEIKYVIKNDGYCPKIYDIWRRYESNYPDPFDYSGTIILFIIIGILMCIACNSH